MKSYIYFWLGILLFTVFFYKFFGTQISHIFDSSPIVVFHGRKLQKHPGGAWLGLHGRANLKSAPAEAAKTEGSQIPDDEKTRNRPIGARSHRNKRHQQKNAKDTKSETDRLETVSEQSSGHLTTIDVTTSLEDDVEIAPPWSDIPMPTTSFYAGFDAPKDPVRWKLAQLQASRGEQVLLAKLLETIKSPFDYIKGSVTFKWIHHVSEYQKARVSGFLRELEGYRGQKAPIVLFGYRLFDRPGFEGQMTGFDSMNPDEIMANPKFTIPRKIVGIGSMDENWGWLSTYFLNRTVPWALNLAKQPSPFEPGFLFCNEYMAKIFDDPNLIALFVNQHNNCSHPKIISIPLGINDPREIWNSVHKAVRSSLKKDQLFFTAGSNWAFRPDIRSCIQKNMKSDMVVNTKLPKEAFRSKIISSMAVLCMPGLGYDTYRLWETIGSGSLPVVERGFGMDRTFYKLPVLLLDDYADLTGDLLRQAYLEALYRVDDWEYERMTTQYWQRLIYEVSETSSIAPLLRQHPVTAEDVNFTRPLVPYDCEKLGGCGPGTKRTPKKYCAIDPQVMSPTYNWVWNHGING